MPRGVNLPRSGLVQVGFLEKRHDQARSGIHFSGNAVYQQEHARR